MRQKHSMRPKFRVGLIILSILLIIGFFISFAGEIPTVKINLRWGILFIALALTAISSFVSYYEYHGLGNQEGIIRKITEQSCVSITFDDGPSPKYTPAILDILKEHDIKASFFVVGKHVKKYPEILKRMVAEGHDVGNHTYNHRDLVPATKATIIKELAKTEDILLQTASIQTNLFRPPRGIYNQTTRKLLVEKGYKIILWSLSSCDWRRNTVTGIMRRIKRFVKDGSIILFHDSGALIRREGGSRGNTVKALPKVIEYLNEQGYKIVPVSELISLKEPEPEAEPVEIQ